MRESETITGALTVHKTAAEIAALVGGRLIGDGSFLIEGVAGLTAAGPGDLSFLGNPKYAAVASASNAGCLLLPLSAAEAPGRCRNRILVDDPQYAFAQVLQLIEARRPKPAPKIDGRAAIAASAKLGRDVAVGPFAVIETDASIGDGSEIGAQVYIGANVRIGRGCKIYPGVVIRENCALGERVIVQPGAVIGGDGYGFATDRKTGRHHKIPQLGNVVIEDDVEIQANTTIDRGTTGSTVIGVGSKIDNLVQIGHNVQVGRDCLLVSQVGVAGSCTVGNHVVLGGQVGIAGHLKVGDGVQVGAQSGLMSDVEPGKVLFGSPARPHREAFKLQALYGRLPELFAALKQIQKKLGLNDVPEA